jgi:ribose transport system permease protein
MAGETIHGFPPSFRQFGSGYLLGVPIPVYVMVLFLAIGTLFAQRTIWGQQIYALGANPEATRLSGVPVERRLLLVYTFSGAMAGLASLIILSWQPLATGLIILLAVGIDTVTRRTAP